MTSRTYYVPLKGRRQISKGREKVELAMTSRVYKPIFPFMEINPNRRVRHVKL